MIINTSLLNWVKNARAFLIGVVLATGFLTQQNGDLILQENGDRIEL